MTWLVTVVMLVQLNAAGDIVGAQPIMETGRKSVEQFEVCEEVAEANNEHYPAVYSTDGTRSITAFDYCERSL